MQDFGDSVGHLWLVFRQFRPLGENDAIEVDDFQTGLPDPPDGNRQHVSGITIPVFLAGIGKQITNISQSGRPQQGIGHRVQQDVSIRMASQLVVKINLDAANSQWTTGLQAMRIMADSDPQLIPIRGHRLSVRGGGLGVPCCIRHRPGGCHCPGDLISPRTGATYNWRMSIIEIRDLGKTYRVYQKKEGLWQSFRGLFQRQYRDVLAVRDVDLSVDAGEFVAFLGPNGAGKTTTLKLLSGVINPTRGSATVMGHVPWKRENEYRRQFALVMGQKNQLWWDLPAQESFRLHQYIYNIPADQFQATQDELTELLDVQQLLNQPVRELSLGERMKMELIAALLHSPRVLFLDEPTIGLDVVAQHKIQQFLKYYQQERQITILLTSHYMKDIRALCERVVIIASGTIQYDGSLSGILDRFSTHKLVTLQLAEGDSFEGLEQIAPVESLQPPRVIYRLPRNDVPAVLARVLDARQVVDVVVEDPPLEEIIAEVFSLAAGRGDDSPEAAEPSAAVG